MKMHPISLATVGLFVAACAQMEAGGTTPPVPGDGASQCRADHYQRFLGRNRSELPPKPAGATWRVTCTTCPVTMDYNPGRLNIFFDESSGVVREVKCG